MNVTESTDGPDHSMDFDGLESCNITLFNKVDRLKEESVFMMEAKGTAVIDTACTRTVCGIKWLNDYNRSLNTNSTTVLHNINKIWFTISVMLLRRFFQERSMVHVHLLS